MKYKYWILVMLIYMVPQGLAKNVTVLSWDLMETLDYKSGKAPDTLKKLDTQMVEVSGFIVPLEGEYLDKIKEFFLVPNPLACVHVPPPPPNQMIYVTMTQDIPLDMDLRGVAITGILTILESNTDDNFASFELFGHSAKDTDIEFTDPIDDILNSTI